MYNGSIMGKGSKRREEDTSKIVNNWDSINWDKPKKEKNKPKK